ncbi:T9SS type A sorting domain-containing protein [Chitinophaga agri]|uniref:T9SS type A sorting domain-containing protein n=1 Tax=Chitinophaga agri TaxID=2703787 RepID=UPI001EE48E5E|nr:T9SS type A sorting domain-containing protein [Chitinophaga agri]
MTIPFQRSLPSVALTLFYCLVCSIFIHAQNNGATENSERSLYLGTLWKNGDGVFNQTPDADSIPVVMAITTTATDGIYGIGSTIVFDVTFDQIVYVNGSTPTLQLKMNGQPAAALYTSGDSTQILTFTYTVSKGDTATILDYASIDALQSNGAGIRGTRGPRALLTLPAPGGPGSLSAQRVIVIDGNAPAAPVITIPSRNAVFTKADMVVGGTAEPHSLVKVYIDGNELTEATADETGSWSSVFTAGSIADGNHNLTATATDVAKNVSPLSIAIPVVTDVTVPGAMSVAILSNNRNSNTAAIGDVITVYFSVDDAIYPPEITIAGTAAPVTAIGVKEYVARYTVTAADADGLVPFMITFRDLHGNTGDTITASTDNSNVYIDKKAPLVTLNTLEMSPFRKPFLVYISFSEPIADFDLSYLRVSNAVITDLNSISNNVMTVLVSPMYDGPVTLELAAGAAHDAAGNPSLASTQLAVQALFGGYFEKVYPNPATGIMRLQFTGTVNDKAKITMASYRGVVVYEKELMMDSKTLTMDVSNIPSGAYILTIRSRNYSFYTNVMVVH